MIINEKSNTPFSGFCVAFKGSVANETKKNFGISHLMEHLQCKNFKDLYSDFTRDGISWNASTYDNVILFYFYGLEKYVAPYRQTFLKKLLSFDLKKETLDNEIQIVLQEYANGFSKQTEAHYENLLRHKYGYYGPIGSKEAIANTTVDMCKEFYDLQYSKPYMIVNISPDGDFDCNIDFSKDYPRVVLSSGNAPIEESAEFNKTSSVINYNLTNKNFKEIKFIARILGDGLESPLYQHVREKLGLVYYIHASAYGLSDAQFMYNISSEMEDKNVSAFQSAVKEVLSQDITEERFNVILKSARVSQEKSAILNYTDFFKHIFAHEYLDAEFLDGISYNKINNLFKENFSNLISSVDKEEFTRIA